MHPLINPSFTATVSLGLLLCVTLLSGCATLRPDSTPPELAARAQFFSQHPNWEIDGKVGVRQGNKGLSASFSWQQQKNNYLLNLNGPLGIGHAQLRKKDAQYEVVSSDGLTMKGDNPSHLIAAASNGLWLPIESLNYWLRGLPEPGSPYHIQTDGQTETLRQNNWQLEYQYRDWGQPLPLPRKIVARSNVNGQPYRVTLVIKGWQFE